LRKALACAILALFLFNSIGYYLLFELNRHLVVREMQSAITNHSEKYTILTIANVSTNKDFQRIHKKEFRYKGEMYDIVRELRTGQKTVFICLHDKKESKLFAGLKRVAGGNKMLFTHWNNMVMIFSSETLNHLPVDFRAIFIVPPQNVLVYPSYIPTWSPPPEKS
jgi:hypothetical protein